MSKPGVESAERPKALRVFVAGWVIQDGSFPRASVGDVVDVALEHHSAGPVRSVLDDKRWATARPAFGAGPRGRDGELRWLHLVHGDGWSGQWWADRPTNGSVMLDGILSAVLDDRAIDRPARVHGRIERMHLVHKQVEKIDNGWRGVDGTERLDETDAVPTGDPWWDPEPIENGHTQTTGILVELDLDMLSPPTPFAAGAVSADGSDVWVMHASDPVLLRVEAAGAVPAITRFLLPLTIEPTDDRWTRRLHAVPGGCWITSEHDVHRCTVVDENSVTIDRYATSGARASAMVDGSLYLIDASGSHMMHNRRHGVIRTWPSTKIRVLDEHHRRTVDVAEQDRPDMTFSRADRAYGPHGIEWQVHETDELLKLDFEAGTTTRIDLNRGVADGQVRSITPSAWDDPANAALIASITVPRPKRA
ncbi:hypothetical protein [Rhodococcus sp. 14-2470-1a]|uniref:hypothetical protein n=1 Tax=Rhodococcus sp. 14-2470-1a TaxID=2023150 RepID=UPI00211AF11F|nr:hypothetical protein [Rhodococcus sp. 14-2470-1a]